MEEELKSHSIKQKYELKEKEEQLKHLEGEKTQLKIQMESMRYQV